MLLNICYYLQCLLFNNALFHYYFKLWGTFYLYFNQTAWFLWIFYTRIEIFINIFEIEMRKPVWSHSTALREQCWQVSKHYDTAVSNLWFDRRKRNSGLDVSLKMRFCWKSQVFFKIFFGENVYLSLNLIWRYLIVLFQLLF